MLTEKRRVKKSIEVCQACTKAQIPYLMEQMEYLFRLPDQANI